MAEISRKPAHGLTDFKLALLPHVAHLQVCTAIQLAGLTGLSYKTTRDHLTDLFRHGLLNRTQLPVISGTSPYIYTLSKMATKHLDVPLFPCPAPLFLPHELEIRDFRVWLEQVRKSYGHEPLRLWKTGMSIGNIEPDAVFIYPLRDGKKLTGMLEADRGTEGLKRWQDKFSRYEAIMNSKQFEDKVKEDRGRILVVTPDARRTDFIVKILSGMLQNARIEPKRFWVTERATLESTDLSAALWRVPEGGDRMPLVPESVL